MRVYIQHVINSFKGKRKTDDSLNQIQTSHKKYTLTLMITGLLLLLLTAYNKLDKNYNHFILGQLTSFGNNKPSNYTYTITPILDGKKGKGALINDIDLCQVFESSSPNEIKAFVAKIKSDVYKYEVMMFKQQCKQNDFNLSPDTFTMIASAFGKISRYDKTDHGNLHGTMITVLSNNKTQGKFKTGSKGWHVDGTAKHTPDGIVFQHIISAPNKGYGGTQIISSKPMIELMKAKNMKLYNQLNRIYARSKSPRVHPLIGKHPITNNEYLCVHSNYSRGFVQVRDESMLYKMDELLKNEYMNDTFIEKYENDNRIKIYSKEETKQLLFNLNEFIENECRDNGLIYVTDYDKGDLLIRDNWALLHISHPSAQMEPTEVGLRVMWRLTIKAKDVPSKF